MLLKILQYSQKNTCVGAYFLIKLQAIKPVTLLRRDSKTNIFLWISQNFWEHLFWRTFQSSHQRCSIKKLFLKILPPIYLYVIKIDIKQELFIKIVNQTEISISFTATFSTASVLEWKAKFLKNNNCLSWGMAQFWKKEGDDLKRGIIPPSKLCIRKVFMNKIVFSVQICIQ